jgi:hypothetical protein
MIEYVHRRNTEKNITPANISLDITNVVLVPLKIICSYVQDFNNIPNQLEINLSNMLLNRNKIAQSQSALL